MLKLKMNSMVKIDILKTIQTPNSHFLRYEPWSFSTQPVWTLFLFKSIWTRSQGSQGCQKIRFFFFTNKTVEFLR